MNKNELKPGALVETREGKQYILIGDMLVNLKDGCYRFLSNLDSNLRTVSFWGTNLSELDVMKVYQDNSPNEGYYQYINKKPIKWTWEREEAVEKPIQFNIGDIVKGNYYNKTKGRIGKVVEKVSNRYLIEYDRYFEGDNGSFLDKKYTRPTNNYWWEKDTTLELVKTVKEEKTLDKKETKHTYKVGDEVRIESMEYYNNPEQRNFIGKTGTVVAVDEEVMPYLVYLGEEFPGHDGGNQSNFHNWYFYETELSGVKEDNFNVGDIVETHFGIGKIVGINKLAPSILHYLVYLGKKFKGHNGGVLAQINNFKQENDHNYYFLDRHLKKVA